MELIIAILFILGTIFGSFYYVIGTRLPNNESVVLSRSHCDNCSHILKWYELIPIISFIFLRGKCYACGAKLSFKYPLIELITGVLFALSYYLYGFSYEFFVAIIIFSLLILIFITDFNYMIILDSPLIISAILITCLKYYYFGHKAVLLSLLSGLIMFLLMLAVKKFGDIVFKRESLGGGDIKLSFVVGLVLGFKLGLATLILSSFLAFPYAFAVSFLNNKKELPFGPFIISAMTIIFLYMDKFADLIAFLFPGI